MGVPRKVVQIAVANTMHPRLIALADDGSLWTKSVVGDNRWHEEEDTLPDAPECGATPSDVTPLYPRCRLRKGHCEEQHWNGIKRWS